MEYKIIGEPMPVVECQLAPAVWARRLAVCFPANLSFKISIPLKVGRA